MPYRERLNSWAVIRLLPNLQRITVTRCRNESDASGHCRILECLEPQAQFIVIFDPVLEDDWIEQLEHPQPDYRS